MIRTLLYCLLKHADTRALLRLSLRHKLYILYFCVSLCFICVTDGSPIWGIVLVVVNLANAARLLRKVPLFMED
jgi:hypothetical protein